MYNHCKKTPRIWLKILPVCKYVLILFACNFLCIELSAQSSSPQREAPFREDKLRVLFIFDASGSMNEMVGQVSRFDLAKDLIMDLYDSIQAKRPDAEIALRIFGHRSSHELSNCEDTALEVPFQVQNREKFKQTIQNIRAVGWTPIALSLYQGATDFPKREENTKNVVIMITDGLETCGGDPCSVAEIYERERIALRPFIVAMGLSTKDMLNFDCIGPNIDGSDPASFPEVSKKVTAYATGGTTMEIRLLDHHNRPKVTNLPITLYDFYSRNRLHHFVHTIGPHGQTDTLKLDPIGKYYVKVHTKPAIYSDAFSLIPGEHNIIDIPILSGSLMIGTRGNPIEMSHIRSVIRDENSGETIYIQDLQTTETYLAGNYRLHILTLPLIEKEIKIEPGGSHDIILQQGGFLNMHGGEGFVAGIFKTEGEKKSKVWESKITENRISLYLQPGNYQIIYRGKPPVESLSTASQKFIINEGGQTNIRF